MNAPHGNETKLAVGGAALALMLLSGCAADTTAASASANANANANDASIAAPLTLATDLAPYFDPVTSPSNSYQVVGTFVPNVTWSWGEIELLEGKQEFRHEDYNGRTEKLRDQDTYDSSSYPLRDYYGELNQELVDAFNLHYQNACATTVGSHCPSPGPTRPEARFVLLHKGPQTAARTCDVNLTPTLLVHGALQDANVFLYPNGYDGQGNAYGGATQVTGMVQALEATGRCVYAVTFGNFHGDNFNQAIDVANAVARIKALHPGVPRVDVVAWSKGVLAVDAWLENPSTWTGYSTTQFFDRLAAAQAARVPLYDDSVRVYVALSGPHKGIDLNFRHPIHTLTIASTSSNAPAGRGPMPWTYFSAFQCVTWGPSSPWYQNPYAQGVCEDAGGTWPDYFRRIYVSNLTGLDSNGKPAWSSSLETLNVNQGLASSAFDFDEFNLSLFGSVDSTGRYVNPYLGQLQSTEDLRTDYPLPDRSSSSWSSVDPDEDRYFPWVDQKLVYNPYNPYVAAGYLDSTHVDCKGTAFAPSSSPCFAYHAYYMNQNAEGYDVYGYGKYRIFSGLGIGTAKTIGGKFISRLSQHGLDSRLPDLYVLYGTNGGSNPDAVFETDGMSCPTCAFHGDGVLFEKSIAAKTQLTQGWSSTKVSSDAKQEGVPYGHLEMGATPAVWNKVIAELQSRD